MGNVETQRKERARCSSETKRGRRINIKFVGKEMAQSIMGPSWGKVERGSKSVNGWTS